MVFFRHRLRTGFALPAVLTVTGVVTIIFLAAITALASLQAEAASARNRVRFLQRALTAETDLAYLLATEPFRPRSLMVGAARNVDDIVAPAMSAPTASGLPEADIWLDGRPYLMDLDGPLVVSLQDAAGLVNLARTPAEVHVRVAQRAGLSATQAQSVLARYLDYTDPDDLRGVNGAERGEYGAAGGPANRALLRPAEWLSILGVRPAVDARRWAEVRPMLIDEPSMVAINVNTAPSAALQLMFGISAAQAESAIRRRETTPFLSLEEFLQAVGSTYPEAMERTYTYPGGRIVYEIRDGRSAWTYRGMIVLTPGALAQPLWIKQTELLEAPRRAAADTTNATRLPYAPD